MVANALIVTIAILLALGFWLLGELKFLIPYRHLLVAQYSWVFLLWLSILFVNVFAAVYTLQRKLLLKDTGRKLSHIDNQVIVGHAPVSSPVIEQERR